MLSHNRPAIKAPFQWRFAGGPIDALCKWYFGSLSLHQKITNKRQSWAPSPSGLAHVMY